jgi:hypothetical protein
MQPHRLMSGCSLALTAVALLAAANVPVEKVELKTVTYAGLEDVIRQNAGRVIVVDFWADY